MLNIKCLHDRIAQIYYTYGLFCASHPFSIIIFVICSVFITCYPLSNLPLPGNTPLEHRTLKNGFSVPGIHVPPPDGLYDEQKRPRWLVGDPVAYVQQVVVKSAVSPWRPQHMLASDAFRAPLASVFSIVQDLENYKIIKGGKETSLADICYRVSEPVSAQHLQGLLPEYSCLLVSPANFWRQDLQRFQKDAEIFQTLYRKYGQVVESPPTAKELLFGIPWKLTGITRYYIRNRQRVITYAITIIMKNYDPEFTSALSKRLEERHPDTAHNVNNSAVEDIVHVYFKDVNYIVEYTPLLVTYFVLLLYLYFSVSKIDMVKSKFGLAISAVVTVLASLLMSVSICTLFGMTPTLNGGEIFPYLVVIVGVENVLVITKSVVSTPVHLDVKIRVAQGLSKEGWSITKNLLTELAIVFVGFFTFVPAIQEFCAFALVGVLSDFYLQMAFFATVLSVDIRRMELSDLHRQSVQQAVQEESNSPLISIQPLVSCPLSSQRSSSETRSQSSPPPDNSPSPQNPSQSSRTSSVSSPRRQHSTDQVFFGSDRPKYEMPRRVKFFYFLARFRIVQKLIMVCTVIWIILIFHKAGLVEKLTGENNVGNVHRPGISRHQSDAGSPVDMIRPDEDVSGHMLGAVREEELAVGPVEHTDLEVWKSLSYKHWPTLFHYYNISLFGRYISILPTIHLSDLIDPHVAMDMRHPTDKKTLASKSPKSSLIDHVSYHEDVHSGENDSQGSGDLPHYNQFDNFYPKSQREFIITICLCVLSVIVITYFMTVLYRCMCSRNYSRWRRSWARTGRRKSKGYFKQIKESVPLVLSGHTQNIECLLGDNGLIVSCCLGGHLKIWDSNSGECINTILRKSIIPQSHRSPCVGRNIEDSDADLYAEYHGGFDSRSSSETSLVEAGGVVDGVRIRRGNSSFTDTPSGYNRRTGRSRKTSQRYLDLTPDLSSTINTDFSSMDSRAKTSSCSGYDFKGMFEGVYEEHRRFLAEDEGDSRNLRVHSHSDLTLLSQLGQRSRTSSYGGQSFLDQSATEEDLVLDQSSSVWCLATLHGLIVTGCGNGRIEVWEGETGELRYHYGISPVGVTGLCVVANKIVAARLDGTLDFLELETFKSPLANPPPIIPQSPHQKKACHWSWPIMFFLWQSTQLHYQGTCHSRNYSTGSIEGIKMWDEVIRCSGVTTYRAHQLPINAIQCAGGRIVTASQDHTLKVFRLDNALCLYTLHGHEGGVTALCLDKVAPYAAVSGSEDGSVRLWDLLTGTCVHKFCWHEASVATLTTSPLYIVSVGLDDRMCVWDRIKSVLLHSIDLDQGGMGSATLMSRNLIVSGGQGNIALWDIPSGSLLRKVIFADGEQRAFVNHVVSVANNGVVCDQGQELKVVFFPTILEKAE